MTVRVDSGYCNYRIQLPPLRLRHNANCIAFSTIKFNYLVPLFSVYLRHSSRRSYNTNNYGKSKGYTINLLISAAAKPTIPPTFVFAIETVSRLFFLKIYFHANTLKKPAIEKGSQIIHMKSPPRYLRIMYSQ